MTAGKWARLIGGLCAVCGSHELLCEVRRCVLRSSVLDSFARSPQLPKDSWAGYAIQARSVWRATVVMVSVCLVLLLVLILCICPALLHQPLHRFRCRPRLTISVRSKPLLLMTLNRHQGATIETNLCVGRHPICYPDLQPRMVRSCLVW